MPRIDLPVHMEEELQRLIGALLNVRAAPGAEGRKRRPLLLVEH